MEVRRMLAPANLRSWATPLTIGTFALMTGSGVLMFFDIVPGYVTFVHEWMSWLFLIAAAAHVLVNSRSFTRHLASRWGPGEPAGLHPGAGGLDPLVRPHHGPTTEV